MESQYFTPSEILELYPELKKTWERPQLLGYLLTLKLVDGFKTKRSCKLNVNDVLDIFKKTK